MKHESLLERLMEQPLAEAREEALQEGIQKGRELGVRETAIDNLLEVLDARFHEQDVALYTPIFEAITDVQLLMQLHHTALRAPTFDDVMQTLKDYRKKTRGLTPVTPKCTRRSANHAGSDEPAQQ